MQSSEKRVSLIGLCFSFTMPAWAKPLHTHSSINYPRPSALGLESNTHWQPLCSPQPQAQWHAWPQAYAALQIMRLMGFFYKRFYRCVLNHSNLPACLTSNEQYKSNGLNQVSTLNCRLFSLPNLIVYRTCHMGPFWYFCVFFKKPDAGHYSLP